MSERPWRRLAARLAAAGLIAALGARAWQACRYARPGRTHLARGEEAAARGQFAEAQREWEAGAREDPAFPDCWERLGDLAQQVRDASGAAADYQAAARLRPDDGPLLLKLAEAQRAAGDERGALASAARATRLLPDDAAAAWAYGDLARRQSQWPQALAALRRAHRLAPTESRYARDLTGLEIDLRDLAGAERALAADPHGGPGDPEWCYLMAVVCTLKPRTPASLKAATAYAARAASGGRGLLRASLLLGQLYLEAGRVRDALGVCVAVLRRSPDNAEALLQRVTCLTRLGRPRQAAAAAAHLRRVTLRRERFEHLQPPAPL
ncbi:MAG: tetratricopeptide repeat protein [Armatimonadetes bacterium]|nr:tetratricopeptide repeat protein [Armatimonadota bacterium]